MAAFNASAQSTSAPEASKKPQIEVITVTAQKRPEDAQKHRSPLQISAAKKLPSKVFVMPEI
ncbi:MAG: hypothetical protein HC782_00370 [Gammaproteobacteria bacterium]|nr:hypothetical protein [Gammaproteobacteria bacterium]